MPNTISERNWNTLIKLIKSQSITPFLGAGAAVERIPLGSTIAGKWAEENHYPYEKTKEDLVKVASYIATLETPGLLKKDLLKRWFEDVQPPDFSKSNEPHALLAELPFPIYMTTNYDSFMYQALARPNGPNKKPLREVCQWNSLARLGESKLVEDSAFEPTVERPVVFHLHGIDEDSNSLVLTEDDYLDFLVNYFEDETFLPHQIRRALIGNSLLMIGYSLADWDFRVLFRILRSKDLSLRGVNVTVQFPPSKKGDDEQSQLRAERTQEYLDTYFSHWSMNVYWGSAKEFTAELRRRWNAAIDDK